MNADINTYLDFKIPVTYPEPITMPHIMSHSSGLDINHFGALAETVEEILPLGEYLPKHLPPRVRPPGVVFSYSNYDVALAGYIVERVSGQPYAMYVEEHILKPLGMAHTTPQMVMPESFNRDMSLTYVYADGAFTSVTDPFRFDQLAPAGCIKSTAADMARYMIAHLQLGADQEALILKTETARLIQQQSFTQASRLRGWAHGFEEMCAANSRVIGHSGVTYHFYSQMALVPEANLGLFVVDNTSTSRELVDSLVETFIDHYFPPSDVPSPTPLRSSSTDPRSIEGSHVPTPFSFGTHEKLRNVIMTFKVQAQADGSLLLSSLMGTKRYMEVEPLFFQTLDRTRSNYMDYRMDQLSFRLDADGKAQYMLANNSGFQKVPWYESLEFALVFSGIILLLFLSVPVAAVFWRASSRLQKQASAQPSSSRLARWLLGLMVALYFLSLFGMFSAFSTENAVLFGKAYAYDAGRFLAIPVALLTVGGGGLRRPGLAVSLLEPRLPHPLHAGRAECVVVVF